MWISIIFVDEFVGNTKLPPAYLAMMHLVVKSCVQATTTATCSPHDMFASGWIHVPSSRHWNHGGMKPPLLSPGRSFRCTPLNTKLPRFVHAYTKVRPCLWLVIEWTHLHGPSPWSWLKWRLQEITAGFPSFGTTGCWAEPHWIRSPPRQPRYLAMKKWLREVGLIRGITTDRTVVRL